jgi:hypothetical protein
MAEEHRFMPMQPLFGAIKREACDFCRRYA